MNKQDVVSQVKQEMERRRRLAEVKTDNYIEQLKKDPTFKDIYLTFNMANLALIKAQHTNQNIENAQKTYTTAKSNLDNYLSLNNINPNKLIPQYKCKKCQDKGIYNGKMCSCLSTEINKRISAMSSSNVNLHTFAMINQTFMNDNLNRIYKQMFDWCNTFPNNIININMLGEAGTGKTFLLECIASKLKELGYNVVFVTAFDFNEECRKYHFSLPNCIENYMECDALILDDLGTEPNLRNITQEYFYNIINSRQNRNKATLISTNLSLQDLFIRYTDRTISRLTNKQLAYSFQFVGKNKRIQ